jgi:hypothetical protein
MAAIPQNPRQNPPWAGPHTIPASKVVANTRQPLEQPESFPFTDASTENPNLFPPVCIRSHWDAEQIIRRTLPKSNKNIAAPLDPRPWTKVCLSYVTSADFEDAPRPSDDVVFPSGGSVYPPTRYRESIDKESLLRRLDRPLGTCERSQYIPPRTGDMYRPNATVEDRGPQNDRFVEELSFPKACMRTSDYDCRVDAEKEAWERSPRLFNNTTKQDRYAVSRPDLAQPRLTASVRPTGMVQLS